MLEHYRDIIKSSSQHIFEQLLHYEHDFSQNLPQLDAVIRPIIREVSRLVIEKLYTHHAKMAISKAKQPGLTVHRNTSIKVFTLYGSVSVPSPYLYDKKKRLSSRPVRETLGLYGELKSLAFERAMTDFGAERSFGRAALQFKEHYGWEVGESTVRTTTLKYARECEQFMDCRLAYESQAYEKSLTERPGVSELLVELDGCDLPVGKLRKLKGRKKTKNRKLPKKTRDCEWREARVGLTRQLEEVNKLYVAKMASYPEVNRQLFGAAVKKGLSSQTQVVAVADGGQGLKEGLSEWFAPMQFILDYPHCSGHLYETADALELEGDEREQWVSELLEWMSEGDVDSVLRYLRGEYLECKVKRVWQLHNYIKRFRDAVHYDDYKKKGWPIGSGEVESAHRYILSRTASTDPTWERPN